MEQGKKRDLLALIDDCRLKREDLMFHIRMSMEEVQRTCQKVELSEKIRVLLSELPLTCKERQRLLTYRRASYPFGSEYFNIVWTQPL